MQLKINQIFKQETLILVPLLSVDEVSTTKEAKVLLKSQIKIDGWTIKGEKDWSKIDQRKSGTQSQKISISIILYPNLDNH